MTDRLTLTRAFEASGMQSEAAERIATEIIRAVEQAASIAALDLNERQGGIAKAFESAGMDRWHGEQIAMQIVELIRHRLR